MMSSHKESLQSELEKLCECSICFDRVTNPRTLPCDHSFCKDCLDELVQFKQKNIPYIRCPNRCGDFVMPPGSTVGKMKTSLYLKQLLDLLSKTNPTHETLHQDLCCNFTGCKRNIFSYCLQCKQFSCQPCLKNNSSCTDKHEIKLVTFSKRRNTIEPLCNKHESSAIYCCQSCSVKYLCKYCKQYSHFDHQVSELSFEQVYKPYQSHLKSLDRYNELLDDVNSIISCIWKNVQVTETNLNRYLERRKLELTLEFFDRLLAAESSIKQHYQTRVQIFSEEIFDRKQRIEKLITKNGTCKHHIDGLAQKSLAEILYDDQLEDVEGIVKENQDTYRSYLQLDEFKVFISPNKEIDLEKPFGKINFSKDALKEDDMLKKMQVLNRVSDSKKEKEETIRRKNLKLIKERLNMMFSNDMFSTFITKDEMVNETKKCGSPTKERMKKVRCKSESNLLKDIEDTHQISIIPPRRKFSEDFHPNIKPNTNFKDRAKDVNIELIDSPPPDIPERSPFRIPDHPPLATPKFHRNASLDEKEHHSLQQNNDGRRTVSLLNDTTTAEHEENDIVSDQINPSNGVPDENITEEHFTGQHDSLPLRKNQLKQKRRPPVLAKPNIKNQAFIPIKTKFQSTKF